MLITIVYKLSFRKTMCILFQKYKSEYHQQTTTSDRKEQLISLMQENLKARLGGKSDSVLCLDGRYHSICSDKVEELYAIDAKLNNVASSDKMSSIADTFRRQSTSPNTYGPENPYPQK